MCFLKITLSRMTVKRRAAAVCPNFNDQIKQIASESSCYTSTTDANTDLKNTAQLLIFIRSVDKNFEIAEELADLCFMVGRTTGKRYRE
jgi:hypothetical protein